MAEELDYSRVERKPFPDKVPSTATIAKTFLGVNNIAMYTVAFLFFDLPGIFLNEIPVIGSILVLVSDLVFLAWFKLSGRKFTRMRAASMAITTLLESLPFVGNFPLITINLVINNIMNSDSGNGK